MKMVICGNYDCLYCDGQYICQKDVISVGEEYSYGCDDYISYLDTDDYKVKFFKAVRTKDGKKAKAVKFKGGILNPVRVVKKTHIKGE